MVQTNSGSIRQLIKGCCLTDRPVMLLLSMSVLTVAIQVIFACECEEQIDWECVMIPEENTTVIMAGVDENNPYFRTTNDTQIQRLLLEKVFKNGPTNLTLIDSVRMIEMHTPLHCSLSLLVKSIYIIYGYTDSDGFFQSSRCNVEVYDDGFFNKTDRENLLETFWGERAKYTSG
ncbi:hypothetical protein CHS0354_032632 [Potamilus streckersoni]|uniref:Uncharacterized protein n=1 Tax=Potamilus streckersoni TaxID=2493646 RepID=A0AAE0SFU9_9BIVA|nr:hypothetical protein CHS0354_032632 [Potamilus streckersoni]